MRQESKDKILEAAILVLSRNPQSSMETIASKSGVSRATLYRHFKTKEMLLKQMIYESERIFDNIIMPIFEMEATAKRKLECFIRSFVPTGARFHFLLYNDLFLSDGEIAKIYNSQAERMQFFAKELKAEGEMDMVVPDEWFATSLEYLIYATWERIYRGDVAPNKAPDLVLNLIFNGIKSK